MNARCKDHPDAPHGYDHNGSHNAGRYVCVCEAWERDEGARMSEIERAQAQRDGLLKPMRPGNQAAGSGLARSEPVSGMSGTELPKLPKLPPIFKKGTIGADLVQGYAREYARAAVLAERERCARVAEGTTKFGAYANGNTIPDEIAAAIRRGSV